MKLAELEEAYKSGSVEKQEYISQMYQKHHDLLFEYGEFIKSRDIQSIEISDGAVIITTRHLGIKMLANRYDERDIPIEILNFGEYEKQDSQMISKLVNDYDTVFDIGGNKGYYSIALAKQYAHLDIHTFEPIANTYENLVANIRLNGVDVNVSNFGLSDEKKELTFYYYKECSGNASSALMNEDKENIELTCQVDTIDNVVKERQLKRLDFIKCDVEGAELLTFRGGVKTLQEYKPIVFTEMLRKWSAKFNYHPNDTLKFFTDLGYRCFYTTATKLKELHKMTDETIETNFFFLHSEKHTLLIEELCGE